MTAKPVLFRVTNNLDVGGITSRLRQVLPVLAQEYQVHVVTYAKQGILVEELQDKGITVHHCPLSGKWSPQGLVKLARLLHAHKANIVHTHSFGGNISGLLAAALARVPLRVGQVHVRQQHWYGRTEFRRKKQMLEEFLVHSLCSHGVLFPSQAALAYFAQHCPLPAQKLHLLYNGIDLSRCLLGAAETGPSPAVELRARLGIAPDYKILGFVGRLIPVKGVEFALNFMRRLPVSAKYCLVFVGTSGDAKRDAALKEQAASDGRIYFVGLQRDPHPYYRAFDAFFFPSEAWTEALPGTVLEAAAHGLPILARENDTVREIATFYDGIHFMQDDADSLKTLAALDAMPRAQPERIWETFSIEAMAKRTITLYNNLLEKLR